MSWIETKKKLPESGKKVLVIRKREIAGFMYHEVGYYQDGKWWNDLIGELEWPGIGDERFIVSHWMELPTEPKN